MLPFCIGEIWSFVHRLVCGPETILVIEVERTEVAATGILETQTYICGGVYLVGVHGIDQYGSRKRT